MVDDTLPRRKFLLGAGLAGASVATGLAGNPAPAAPEATAAAPAGPPAHANAEPETYQALSATEVAFLSAVEVGATTARPGATPTTARRGSPSAGRDRSACCTAGE